MDDKERLNFIDKMLSDGNGFKIDEWQMFTAATQRQPVENIRRAIDLWVEYAEGRRCLVCDEPAFGEEGVRVHMCGKHPATDGTIPLSEYWRKGGKVSITY